MLISFLSLNKKKKKYYLEVQYLPFSKLQNKSKAIFSYIFESACV